MATMHSGIDSRAELGQHSRDSSSRVAELRNWLEELAPASGREEAPGPERYSTSDHTIFVKRVNGIYRIQIGDRHIQVPEEGLIRISLIRFDLWPDNHISQYSGRAGSMDTIAEYVGSQEFRKIFPWILQRNYGLSPDQVMQYTALLDTAHEIQRASGVSYEESVEKAYQELNPTSQIWTGLLVGQVYRGGLELQQRDEQSLVLSDEPPETSVDRLRKLTRELTPA